MAVSSDDPVWGKKAYAADPKKPHDSTIQDWEAKSLAGGPVTLRFKEFATKHLLKPSAKGLTAVKKAEIIHSKRSRTHALSQDATKGHWQVKYGTKTQTNTMIDLDSINLQTVVERFATEILKSDSSLKWSVNSKDGYPVTVDLGTTVFVVATDSGVRRTGHTKVTFKAKKLGNRSYEIFHLVRSHK